MTTPEYTVTFQARKRGGYYAHVTFSEDETLSFVVQEVANHMRTTSYFKWHAKSISVGSKGASADDRTRIGAVRGAVRLIQYRADKTAD